jgi:hypothetical protein
MRTARPQTIVRGLSPRPQRYFVICSAVCCFNIHYLLSWSFRQGTIKHKIRSPNSSSVTTQSRCITAILLRISLISYHSLMDSWHRTAAKHSRHIVTGTEYFNRVNFFFLSENKLKRAVSVENSFRPQVIYIQLQAAFSPTGSCAYATAMKLRIHQQTLIFTVWKEIIPAGDTWKVRLKYYTHTYIYIYIYI